MDVLKMRFTPPFTLRSRRSRNDPGSSAAAENLLRRCPKRAGSLKSARGSAHGDAQRVCYITALWPTKHVARPARRATPYAIPWTDFDELARSGYLRGHVCAAV